MCAQVVGEAGEAALRLTRIERLFSAPAPLSVSKSGGGGEGGGGGGGGGASSLAAGEGGEGGAPDGLAAAMAALDVVDSDEEGAADVTTK